MIVRRCLVVRSHLSLTRLPRMPPLQRLSPQSFSHSTLDRSVDRRDASALASALQKCSLLLVQGREVFVTHQGAGSQTELHTVSPASLATLGLAVREGAVECVHSGTRVPAYLLGRQHSGGEFVVALDLSGGGPLGARLGPLLGAQGAQPRDLRSLLALLPSPQLGVAGQAVALSTWHQANAFCGRCGAATEAVEAGSKRACGNGHRVYPRTDPVVIMLIESPDGSQALLGRPRALQSRGPVLTCLSGFVEQGESLEDAVRREVREEAGLEVGAVSILGSQPWPLGRGGSCELMIGCSGQALSGEVHADQVEMADVRWVGREEVAAAVAAAKQPRDPFTSAPLLVFLQMNSTEWLSRWTDLYYDSWGPGRLPDDSPIDFFIPPPYAIAHHLIASWLGSGPFFPTKL